MKPQLLATGCHFPVSRWEKKRNPQRLFKEFYCGHSLQHVAVYKEKEQKGPKLTLSLCHGQPDNRGHVF